MEVTSDIEQPTEYRTRYGRRVIRTQRWIESNEQDRASSHHRMVLSSTSRYNIAEDPIAMTTTVGYLMYMHQAMRQPHREVFIKAMIKEVLTHQKRKLWKII